MNQKEINAAVDYIYTHGQKYAEAKAHVTYLEEFRKSKKAMLMKTALAEKRATSATAAEMEAYADVEYIQWLNTLREAVEKAEGLRWGLVSAQARVEVWRSMEASNRVMDRAVS
jgi:hypothetical protein